MKLSASTPVIITGGASGLGAGTSAQLSKLGCPVTVFDLPSAENERQVQHAGHAFIACDVSDAASVGAAVEQAVANNGIPRLVVNCAGIASAMRTITREGPHDDKLFIRTVSVNLIGSFLVSSKVAAQMAENEPLADGERGLIINTASVAAFDGQVGQAAYAASKAGIVGMTLPMARDLASLGVRVLTIAPGIFETPMLAEMPQEVRDSLAAQVPFPKRLGTPNDYASLVVHLAENTMLNAETIRLDGAIRMGAK